MKFIKNITLALSICAFALTACQEDDSLPIGLTIDKTEVLSAAEGVSETIAITSGAEWTASSSEPWVTLSPANGMGQTDCELIIDPSLIHGVRKARVRITDANGNMQAITVSQFGFDKVILIEEENISIESFAAYEKRYFEAKITTNIPFKVQTAEDCDWINFDNKQLEEIENKHARPQSFKLRFDWTMNGKSEVRTADINFLPADAEVILENKAIITVTQKGAPIIEDSRSGDSLAMVLAANKLRCYTEFNTVENINLWNGVKVWDKRDEGVTPEMVGRVRSVVFYMMDTKEGIPDEVSKLKYVESLSFYSNVNAYLRKIDIGDALNNLEYLKNLELFSYGIVDLPEGLKNLKKLEFLNISSNNFSNIPSILTAENFPNLKHIDISSTRKYDYLVDLSTNMSDDMGLYMDISNIYIDKMRFEEFIKWDKLESLQLGVNYIEGELPSLDDYAVKYTEEDIIASNDSLPRILIGTPKVWTNMKEVKLNLNMMTGKIPNWILHHPNLWMWNPFTLIYNQEGFTSSAKKAGFDNVPFNWEYYYDLYPFRRPTLED